MSTLGTVCEALLAEADACLTAAGAPVGRKVIVTGPVAWDDCCDGMLYVAVVRIYRSEQFPAEDTNWRPCAYAPVAAELAVGVLRCSPSIGDDGSPPPEADINAVTLQVLDDEENLRACLQKTLCSDEGPFNGDRAFLVAGSSPLGDEGGCVGIELQVAVEL